MEFPCNTLALLLLGGDQFAREKLQVLSVLRFYFPLFPQSILEATGIRRRKHPNT